MKSICGSEFGFLLILDLFEGSNFPNYQKPEPYKWQKHQCLELLHSPNLISHKILKTEKS